MEGLSFACASYKLMCFCENSTPPLSAHPAHLTQVKPHGLSQFQTFVAYMGGSAIQTVGDNPVTAYRQLVQQYAKGQDGKPVDSKVAVSATHAERSAWPNPFAVGRVGSGLQAASGGVERAGVE